MTNVLFMTETRDELKEYLLKNTNNGSIDLIFPEDTSEENILKLARDADIIVGWRPSREMLDTAAGLKLFINPGVGVQNIIGLFKEVNEDRELILVNGHGNTYYTAQNTVAILLALLFKLVPHHNWMMEGRWRTGDEEGEATPLRHRRIGLLGYGHLNSKVHRFLANFEVDFSVLKRSWNRMEHDIPTPINKFDDTQLHEFLKEIDILIIGLPQTTDTKALIGERELELLGPDGILINVSRGRIVDEEALFNALKDENIAGAGLDVWYEYRPEPDAEERKYPYSFPFHELDNIVMSPHRCYSPFDSLERWDEVVENIKKVDAGRTDFINIVDLKRGY
ncbi:MAG: hypothetical protein KAS16_01640 [Thermoplasmata archaeon]|nr:hypothetical protein [Thermoplasmata archaeon]